MSVAWFESKKGAIRLPSERNLGWPTRTLPHQRLTWKRP
jgi:hypothetical protein